MLSQARVVTRFIDFPQLLAHRIQAGGWLPGSGATHERILHLIQNIADTAYYPVEHVAFLIDMKLLRWRKGSARWWSNSCLIWATSLLCSILLQFKKLVKGVLIPWLAQLKHKVKHHGGSMDVSMRERSGEALPVDQKKIKTIAMGDELREYLLPLVRDVCDFINAVGWGPPGLLWANRIPPKLVPLFGLLSSMISIHRIVNRERQRLAKEKEADGMKKGM